MLGVVRQLGVGGYACVIGWAGVEDNGNLYLSIESNKCPFYLPCLESSIALDNEQS